MKFLLCGFCTLLYAVVIPLKMCKMSLYIYLLVFLVTITYISIVLGLLVDIRYQSFWLRLLSEVILFTYIAKSSEQQFSYGKERKPKAFNP